MPSGNGKWLCTQLIIRKSCIYLRNNETGKSQRLFSQHFKNRFQEADTEYPIFAGAMATKNFVSTQRRDNIYIRKYSIQDLKYAEQLLPNEVQRLYSLSYIDKRYLLINAAIDGFSIL